MVTLQINTEQLSNVFSKFHFQISKFPITLHHFTAPDLSNPHDHPYAFTSMILAGGYVEERWVRGPMGVWRVWNSDVWSKDDA